MSKTLLFVLCWLLIGSPLTACSDANKRTASNLIHHKQKKITLIEKSTPLIKSSESRGIPVDEIRNGNYTTTEEKMTKPLKSQVGSSLNKDGTQVVVKPDSIPVLVNKQNK